MRGFWQGIIFGGLAGVMLGMMAAPRFQEEIMGMPMMKKTEEQLSSLANKAIRGVQDNVGEMWQRRLKD